MSIYQKSTAATPGECGDAADSHHGNKWDALSSAQMSTPIRFVSFANIGPIVVRKTVFDALGGFNTSCGGSRFGLVARRVTLDGGRVFQQVLEARADGHRLRPRACEPDMARGLAGCGDLPLARHCVPQWLRRQGLSERPGSAEGADGGQPRQVRQIIRVGLAEIRRRRARARAHAAGTRRSLHHTQRRSRARWHSHSEDSLAT